jgi:hypothetical protein
LCSEDAVKKAIHTILFWLAALVPLAALPAGEPRFYPDDPLLVGAAPRNVGKILGRKFSDYFDFFYSSFGNPTGVDPRAPVPRAQAVNTLDEAMDSAWWQRRHYYRPMTTEELVRGPGGDRPPSPTGKWTVTSPKNEGVTPGFTIVDETGEKYFLKFDPIGHPGNGECSGRACFRFFTRSATTCRTITSSNSIRSGWRFGKGRRSRTNSARNAR